MIAEYRFLRFVGLQDLETWDVKRYINQNEYLNRVPFFEVLSKSDVIEKVLLEVDKKYKILGVRVYAKGVFISREAIGSSLITETTKYYYKAKSNHLFWCKVDTKNGAFGITKEEHDGCFASHNMSFAKINTNKISVEFLQLMFQEKRFQEYLDSFMVGTTNRQYIKFDELLAIQIPLPPLAVQKTLVEAYTAKTMLAKQKEEKANELEKSIDEYLITELGIEVQKKEVVESEYKFLRFVGFEELKEWGVDKILNRNLIISNKYKIISLNNNIDLYIDIFRGKSPKYDDNSNQAMVNQKCVRWNELSLEFAKKVDTKWLSEIKDEFFTKQNDILINSTGEGTIGRATCIDKIEWLNLLYDSHVLLLRLNQDKVNTLFFTEFFNSFFVQNQINIIKSAQSTKQTELGIDNLKKIQLPLPPLSIQNRIATHIGNLKEQIKTLRNEAGRLRTSAKQEFEGAVFE